MTPTQKAAMEQALEAIRSTEAYKYGSVMLNEAAEDLISALAEQPAEQGVDWEKLYRLEVKKKEALAAKYERDTGMRLEQVVPLTAQPAEQEPVKFLANGTRFKMSFFQNEDGEGNTEPGTHVTCFEAFEEQLDGRWVALVPAEDDCHLKYTAPQPKAEPQGEPFKPDWVNYRQGLHDGWAEGYEQGVADERASEAPIGIAGFGAKVSPARVNPYKSTAPQPTTLEPVNQRLLKALRGLIAFAEAAETKMLVGDEGCLWPVEDARETIAAVEKEMKS